MSGDLETYEVASPVRHNGQRYETGELIELDDDAAASLLRTIPPSVRRVRVVERVVERRLKAVPPKTVEPVVPVKDSEFSELVNDEYEPEELLDTDGEEVEIDTNEGDADLLSHPSDELIDINAGTPAQLEALELLGASSVKLIVQGRPYSALDEVPEKSGITGIAKTKWGQISKRLKV